MYIIIKIKVIIIFNEKCMLGGTGIETILISNNNNKASLHLTGSYNFRECEEKVEKSSRNNNNNKNKFK
jgi:hypothetical protein